MTKTLSHIAGDFLGLFFPRLCLGCGNGLAPSQKNICLSCSNDLAYPDFHLHKENLMSERFWGRIAVENTAALYYFAKGNVAQNLIFSIKYSGHKALGIELGEKHGKILAETAWISDMDGIIPVPLHRQRKRKRGYNQSDLYAEGLSQTTQIPILAKAIKRTENTRTQTKKTRIERFENVSEAFEVDATLLKENGHYLLVDDVLTTGATIEACALSLLKSKSIKISIATLGFVDNS